MVASLLKMPALDWTVPDYTTLCQRWKPTSDVHNAVQAPIRRLPHCHGLVRARFPLAPRVSGQ